MESNKWLEIADKMQQKVSLLEEVRELEKAIEKNHVTLDYEAGLVFGLRTMAEYGSLTLKQENIIRTHMRGIKAIIGHE